LGPGILTHACNSRYMGDGIGRITVWTQPGRKLTRPLSTNDWALWQQAVFSATWGSTNRMIVKQDLISKIAKAKMAKGVSDSSVKVPVL
jgi:hypothetical protein